MKTLLLVFGFLCFLALSGSVYALRLTDGLYFTVNQNSTSEVYFILPDDVGGGQDKADYFITNVADWDTDLTDRIVTTDENNTAIIPIKFFSSQKKEGDCSNYTISISAPSLRISRTWKGGVCLSKYMDVDISKGGGDAKEVLNNNVDLFSVGFRTYSKTVKPGEIVSLELLLQSQASLTIDVNVQSSVPFEKKSFSVQTGSSQKVIYLNASSVPSGSYDVIVTARARGCSLDSCTKQSSMKLVVSQEEPREGFSISLFPDNLAIKNLEPVAYSFTIQSTYKDERVFSLIVERPFDLDSSLIADYVTVPALSEKTVNFTVTPRNQTGFYEIKVTASTNYVEKTESAYLSTNEMVSDVYRNAEDAKAEVNSSSRDNIDKNVKNWYSSYTRSDGSNTTGFASLQDAIDSAKKQAESPNGEEQNGTQEEEKPASNPLGIILIPVVLGAVVFVILLLFRRKQQPEDGETLESL